MPWDEVAWVNALEYIPGSFSLPSVLRSIDPLEDEPVPIEGRASKYADFASFISLVSTLYAYIPVTGMAESDRQTNTQFESAMPALRRAHEWHIHHLDISDANILVDEEHDYAVLIDFINIARLQIMEMPEDLYLWACQRDVEYLVREFLQCRRHHSEFVKYLCAGQPT